MKTLLCLHGWGGSSASFDELRHALGGSDIEVLAPDLPGFGREPEPATAWTADDYVAWITNYIANNIDGDYMLLGHSRGGHFAINLITVKLPTTNYQLPTRLFLCASAGIHHPRHIKRTIGLTLAKSGKFFLSIPILKSLQPLGKTFLYKLVRVHDYEKASRVMRQTLINLSKEDVRPLLPRITIPTDIFWGEADTMTVLSDGTYMQKHIPNATLHTFKEVRHRVHRDKAEEIAAVVRG